MTRNPYYRGPVTDHFDGTRFHLPDGSTDKSRADLWRLMRTPFADWPKAVADPPAPHPAARVEGGALKVTSIGHASHLIQTRGHNILVDPVWSTRTSPLPFAGPKRVRPPGLALDALPPIDTILITHNHYDHLDLATLRRLGTAHRSRIIVPLGNDAIVRKAGADLRVEAYDWDDRVALNDALHVTLLPSRHWSARGLGDRRMALWAAFLIETPDGAIYHIGDTGYGDGALFREVPRRYGRPRLAIIPIGAYAPRWFMRDQHVEPAESVAIFRDCNAHYALAHHWGTFRLTAEAIDDPPRQLATALAAAAVPTDRFRVQAPGQVFDVSSTAEADPSSAV